MNIMQPVTAQHIEMRHSEIHGTKPCVAGTRIRVEDIYVLHEIRGQTPHEIIASFPQLSLADVHAALAYYWDNHELMQRQMKRGHEVAEDIKAANSALLPEKLAERGTDADSVSP